MLPSPTRRLSAAVLLLCVAALTSAQDRVALVNRALAASPASTRAVTSAGRPVALIRDIDLDGHEDVFLLTIEGAAAVEWSSLQNPSRLFSSETDAHSFFLEAFLGSEDGPHLLGSFPMGRKTVLDTFELRQIMVDAPTPVAIVIRFEEIQGAEERWTIVTEDGEVSFLALYESPRMSFRYEDINGDGRNDIVISQQGFEAGTGFETFITWYNWNGRDYVVHRATNVVRNLNRFFAEVRGLVAQSRTDELIDLAFRQAEEAVDLETVLVPVPDTPADAARRVIAALTGTSGDRISDVVFPTILENPFLRTSQEWVFTPLVRVDCCGESYFFRVRVAMDQNPFSGRQFYFVPQDQPGA